MQKVKLGDIAEYINGYPFKPTDWSERGYPIIRIQDLTGSDYQTNKFNGKVDSRYEVNDGDILISWSATLGIYIWNRGKAYLNQHIFKVILNTDIVDKWYFYYQVDNLLKGAQSEAHGATMKHLTKGVFNNLPFILPTMVKQKNIANYFCLIDNIIEKRNQQLAKLDELIKSKFTEMFGDPQLNEKSWKRALLKDIAIGKLSYGSGASAIPYDGVTRYIRITDILGNGELSNDIKSPSQIDEKYILHNGDILFARSGATVGKTLCYNENMGKAIYAGYLIRLVPNPDKVLPIYVYYYTKTDYYKDFIQSNQKIVAQPNINAQEYGDLLICLPTLDLQNQFADFVEKVEVLKSKVKQSLAQLEVLKKSLMQKYFG